MEVQHPVQCADDCRERARQFFAMAIAEENLEQRERWLAQGERWMQRWRYWAPSAVEAA